MPLGTNLQGICMKPYQSLYHELFRAPKRPETPEAFVAFIDALCHFHGVQLMDANRGYLRGDSAGAPCLVFKAPISQVKRINALLMELNTLNLHHHWTLTGKLDGLNQLFFSLIVTRTWWSRKSQWRIHVGDNGLASKTHRLRNKAPHRTHEWNATLRNKATAQRWIDEWLSIYWAFLTLRHHFCFAL